MKDYDILPDSGLDIVNKFNKVLSDVEAIKEACKLIFEKGIYDAYVSNLTPIDIHISNTNSELENNSIL